MERTNHHWAEAKGAVLPGQDETYNGLATGRVVVWKKLSGPGTNRRDGIKRWMVHLIHPGSFMWILLWGAINTGPWLFEGEPYAL